MRCDEVQHWASAWCDEELSDRRGRAVAEHIAQCGVCRDCVVQLQTTSERLGRLGRKPMQPRPERQIRDAIADEENADSAQKDSLRAQRSWRGFVQEAVAVAAGCVFSVLGTWAAMQQSGGHSTTEHDVIAAHVRSLLSDSPAQVLSSDRHTVRPWFAGKVDFAPPVRDLASQGFPLVGGRLDYVDRRRVATLIYRHGLHTISLFIWPEPATESVAKSSAQTERLNVLSWSKDGMVWWAVSDEGPSELREFRTLL